MIFIDVRDVVAAHVDDASNVSDESKNLRMIWRTFHQRFQLRLFQKARPFFKQLFSAD
jgi:hypothetical protein